MGEMALSDRIFRIQARTRKINVSTQPKKDISVLDPVLEYHII